MSHYYFGNQKENHKTSGNNSRWNSLQVCPGKHLKNLFQTAFQAIDFIIIINSENCKTNKHPSV